MGRDVPERGSGSGCRHGEGLPDTPGGDLALATGKLVLLSRLLLKNNTVLVIINILLSSFIIFIVQLVQIIYINLALATGTEIAAYERIRSAIRHFDM